MKGVKQQLTSMGAWLVGLNLMREKIKSENHGQEQERRTVKSQRNLGFSVEEDKGYRSRTRSVKSSWDVSEH